MIPALLLFMISLMMFGLSLRLVYGALRDPATNRVLERLGAAQPALGQKSVSVAWLDRAFLQAGLGRPSERIGLWLAMWAGVALLAGLIGGWVFLFALLVLPPLLLKLFVSWRYQRRVKRMVEQLPQLLDSCVRSLKSGRTLADAVLHAIESSSDPLKSSISRVSRNVQLGVSLPEAVQDFAELYEREEFRMFALGLKVNYRYGGNASELLENLIVLIRERDQGARRLRAMTGETRITALVLALLPLLVGGYFMLTNPTYLINMWHDSAGQYALLTAFIMQAIGCLALWRMVRSV
ncbi:tight adherence protein B [Pseudomonas taetrolens]|uniref:Tight adherence protein B n=1 Tax=Pseudomonas taetrolens TaxID=47884 RepID=A0A0J6JI45_PSETA|nr:type II secretion system F family protein [Pseudomonas taetrolens]KMM83427.1 type II secretion system protein F [Pseudomonas taetrolens]SED54068.1 tight adherence protein B [Pseudomonas taetrolens]SQF88141.1 type II secretion system protein [Pseudomonas taetrolens]VEH51331.1 type II secretion system protein [Pseudomonas taetrolens]